VVPPDFARAVALASLHDNGVGRLMIVDQGRILHRLPPTLQRGKITRGAKNALAYCLAPTGNSLSGPKASYGLWKRLSIHLFIVHNPSTLPFACQ